MNKSEPEHSNVIIFGASGGIGSRVAERLVESGSSVMLAARPSDRLTSLSSHLDMPSCSVEATDFESVEKCFLESREQFGRIDGCVNCVGSILLKPAHLTSAKEFSDVISANLTSSFAMVRAAGKMMNSTGGSAVLLSSAAARMGLASHEAIAAAKAGVIGLAKSAAATYAARGLRFNVVAPGLVKTELSRKIWENPISAAASESMHPLGRLGEPDDIASLICWLLQPSNSWVTGEVFSIDGGLAMVRPNPRPAKKPR